MELTLLSCLSLFISVRMFLDVYKRQDKPSDSPDEPELKFFDDVYTTWDDTQVLQGKIGEFVTIARRKGEEWFTLQIPVHSHPEDSHHKW